MLWTTVASNGVGCVGCIALHELRLCSYISHVVLVTRIVMDIEFL